MIAGLLVACVLWSLAGPGATRATAEEAADARGRELLSRKLATLQGAEGGQIIPVTEEALNRAFAGHLFYVLRFRQYPVQRETPEPLQPNNLFVVRPDDRIDHLADPEALETFFRAALRPVRTEAQAREAGRAWLRLAQEFHQDGFFRFEIPEDALSVRPTDTGGREITGKARVKPQGGNAGDIVATLTFGPSGELAKVAETVTLKRGIRPICQATRLLDPDPAVRRRAEEDILLMGETARDYLDERRERAGAALRREIDRLWRRILDGEQ